MTLVAKLFLAFIVLLGLSDNALAQGAGVAGAAAVGLVVFGIYAIAALPALLALALAFFPRTRPTAVWLSLLAQLPCLLFILFTYMNSGEGGFVMWARPDYVSFAALPEYISLVALNLGLRGAAPATRVSKLVLVLLLVSPVAAIAMAGASHWIGRGPSYQGKALAEWVGEGDSEQAAEAVRQVGPRALPFLLRWLDDERGLNMAAFGGLAPADAALAIPELTRRLNSPLSQRARAESRDSRWSRRERAMLALSYLGPAAVPAMAAALSNPEPSGLRSAAESIKNLGANARPLMPLLVQNLEHKDRMVVLSAVKSLGFLKYEPELIVPALAKSLENSDPEIRSEAIRSLGAWGELACPAAVPALITALNNDPDTPSVEPGAGELLGKMKCAPDLVVPALVKSLGHPSKHVRHRALGALYAYGELAFCPAVVPVLIKALNDDKRDREVSDLVYKIGKLQCEPDRVVPALVNSLDLVAPDALVAGADNSSADFRSSAVTALAGYGELARPALQALGAALSDRDSDVRRKKARRILDNIKALTYDNDPKVREGVGGILEKIGGAGMQVR